MQETIDKNCRIDKNGFSLLELMLVLTIISLLAGIAYPIYNHVLLLAKRIDAKIALINLANQLELYYLKNANSYANVSLEKLNFEPFSEKKFYRLSIKSTDNTYILTAKPLFNDSECQYFTLNELGEKNNSGHANHCW